VRLPPPWNSLRAGRRGLAHGLASVEETLGPDSVAIATANVKPDGTRSRWPCTGQGGARSQERDNHLVAYELEKGSRP
jgi:hypothetical protein